MKRGQKTMTKAELAQAIKTIIEDMTTDEVVTLHNEYCYASNQYDDVIYDMNCFDDEMIGLSPMDIARKIYYGEFCPNADRFKFDGCANLKSIWGCDVYNEIYIDEIIHHIINEWDALHNAEILELLDDLETELIIDTE